MAAVGGSQRPDLYKIMDLGAEEAAEKKKLRTAYQKQALVWHPDKFKPKTSIDNGADEATRAQQLQAIKREQHEAQEKFKTIAMAYSILGDDDARAEYDNAFPATIGKDVRTKQLAPRMASPRMASPHMASPLMASVHLRFLLLLRVCVRACVCVCARVCVRARLSFRTPPEGRCRSIDAG
jgi:curved DNA-binding protein CbpA